MFLCSRNVSGTKAPYPTKRLEVIRWFNQKGLALAKACLEQPGVSMVVSVNVQYMPS